MKPNVESMLDLGETCGLTTVEEAYNNVMLHYDAFFTIANLKEEEHALHCEMKQYRLIERVPEKNNVWRIKDVTIKEAKERLL